MFENLKQAQRTGMTAKERRRFLFYLVMLVLVAGTFMGLRTCQTLPGRRELPKAEDSAAAERAKRKVDRARLLAEVKDDDNAHLAFQERAIEYVRSLISLGLGEAPVPVTATDLAQRPFAAAAGGVFEVEGRITALTHTAYRSDLETLWALVLEGAEGGQLLALKIGSSQEPGAGAPTDAWPVAPVELQVGDRAVVRGVYVQRRAGTVGSIALDTPAPVLLCSHFRRQVDPPADPIADLSEAAFDKIDDRFYAGTARQDDPAIYEVLQWARLKGHAWMRAQIDSGALKVAEWGRDEFDRWSDEAGLRTAEQPRPFTEGARGKVFRTSGLVGKVLLDDWDSLRPNPWGVNQVHDVYLWSDYYGNRVVPCLSAYPWEAFGVQDWRALEERVYIYGVFVKNHTYDTSFAAKEGTGYQQITMPLFVVLDVRPYPISRGTGFGLVGVVIFGMALFAGITYMLLRRSERRESEALRDKLAGWKRKHRGAVGGPVGGDAPTEPEPGSEPPGPGTS